MTRPCDLRLDGETMRRLGALVMDAMIACFEEAADRPAVRVGSAEALLERLGGPPPEDGEPFDAILERLERDVFAHGVNLAHPRFFAFIPGPGNFIGTLADALVAAHNPFAGTWLGGSGPAVLEHVVVDWLREACGLPGTGGGLLTGGGSAANLLAVAAARIVRAPRGPGGCTAYLASTAHASVRRALRIVGLSDDAVRTVRVRDDHTLDPGALAEAMAADRAAGRRPLCVVASAGTTATGAVDPVGAIADVCARYDAWLHVDGAYGAAAALSPRLRPRLGAIERADSITIDPHKWLFQPFAVGCLLVRDARVLERAFAIDADYLRDVHALGGRNYADLGFELTRPARAVKVWATMRFFGARRIRAAIEHGVELAEAAAEVIARRDDTVVVTPPSLGIVTFRLRDADDAAHDALVRRVIASGEAMVSSARVDGRTVLRLCTINPASTIADVEATLDGLAARIGRGD